MKLNRNNRLVRIGYCEVWPFSLAPDSWDRVPNSVSICTLFWRIVCFPIWCVLIPTAVLIPIGIFTLFGYLFGGMVRRTCEPGTPTFFTVIRAYLKARKQKFCPMITIVKETDGTP
jgi:hypothetical protein